mgnify:CR=1 FL=1
MFICARNCIVVSWARISQHPASGCAWPPRTTTTTTYIAILLELLEEELSFLWAENEASLKVEVLHDGLGVALLELALADRTTERRAFEVVALMDLETLRKDVSHHDKVVFLTT